MTDQLLKGRLYLTDHVYVTGTRQALTNVHDPSECEDRHCCIHAPSRHPLVNAPTHWRCEDLVTEGEEWVRQVMERICPCGNFHPDPDDLRYIAEEEGEAKATRIAQHNCCGCCS